MAAPETPTQEVETRTLYICDRGHVDTSTLRGVCWQCFPGGRSGHPTQQAVEHVTLEDHQRRIAALEVQRDQLDQQVREMEGRLAECYRLTGSDPDGDSDSMLAQHAVQAVRELREEADKAGEWEERAVEAERQVREPPLRASQVETLRAVGRFEGDQYGDPGSGASPARVADHLERPRRSDNFAKAVANGWLRLVASRDYRNRLRAVIATAFEVARFKAKETDCGVCGVPAFCMVEVCEGYAVPRCEAHKDSPPYQAEARLYSLLSLASSGKELGG